MAQRIDSLRWWIGTVVLTIFPTLATSLVAVLTGTSVDWLFLFGDGEMVLSSFVIVTSTLISCYNIRTENLFLVDGLYHLMLFIDFFELIAYTAIKINPDNSVAAVCATSFFCLITSVSISWLWTRIIRKR